MGTSFEPPKKDSKPVVKKITSLPKSALEEKEEEEERCAPARPGPAGRSIHLHSLSSRVGVAAHPDKLHSLPFPLRPFPLIYSR